MPASSVAINKMEYRVGVAGIVQSAPRTGVLLAVHMAAGKTLQD